MQILRDSKSILEVARTWSDHELRGLFSIHVKRLKEYEEYDLSELVCFIVCEECDSVADLDTALGFSIMANRFDGVKFGESGFHPSWEFVIKYNGWYEIVYVLSDDGTGVVVFVDKQGDTELVQMLRFYTG